MPNDGVVLRWVQIIINESSSSAWGLNLDWLRLEEHTSSKKQSGSRTVDGNAAQQSEQWQNTGAGNLNVPLQNIIATKSKREGNMVWTKDGVKGFLTSHFKS